MDVGCGHLPYSAACSTLLFDRWLSVDNRKGRSAWLWGDGVDMGGGRAAWCVVAWRRRGDEGGACGHCRLRSSQLAKTEEPAETQVADRRRAIHDHPQRASMRRLIPRIPGMPNASSCVALGSARMRVEGEGEGRRETHCEGKAGGAVRDAEVAQFLH